MNKESIKDLFAREFAAAVKRDAQGSNRVLCTRVKPAVTTPAYPVSDAVVVVIKRSRRCGR